jgi:hypothetical protein
MLATGGGWALDAFYVQVYSYVIPTLDGPFRGNRRRWLHRRSELATESKLATIPEKKP